MKVCLISFDYWNYDYHIVESLQKKGVDVTHIDISQYKYEYKNFFYKTGNFLSKLFFKRNIKKIKRQEFILTELNRMGKQDYILCIRPDLIDKQAHLKIKSFTKKYVAYIYDSCKRFPIDHLLDNVFDKIYSFDLDDVKTFNFTHLTNYIYLEKQEIKHHFKYDVFIVMSPDQRIPQLNEIARQLDTINSNYKFIIVSQKKPSNLYKNIEFSNDEIDLKQLKWYLEHSKILLDLVRDGHNGLSFRVFEALAYQKKLITTNSTITGYEFYNPNNIMVLDPENIKIDSTFLSKDYVPLNEDVFNKFTVDRFVDTIFEIKN